MSTHRLHIDGNVYPANVHELNFELPSTEGTLRLFKPSPSIRRALEGSTMIGTHLDLKITALNCGVIIYSARIDPWQLEFKQDGDIIVSFTEVNTAPTKETKMKTFNGKTLEQIELDIKNSEDVSELRDLYDDLNKKVNTNSKNVENVEKEIAKLKETLKSLQAEMGQYGDNDYSDLQATVKRRIAEVVVNQPRAKKKGRK